MLCHQTKFKINDYTFEIHFRLYFGKYMETFPLHFPERA
jgi:hypothetical protein